MTCKKAQGKVLRPPPTPSLSECQVYAEFPFQVTGFEFAGSLFVKDIYAKSSNVNKCFILIFTLLVIISKHIVFLRIFINRISQIMVTRNNIIFKYGP